MFEVLDSTWMRIFIVICLPDSIRIVYIIKVSFVVSCMQSLFGLSLLTVLILLDCNWSERIKWTYLNPWFDAHLVIINPSTYLWAAEGKTAVLREFKAAIAQKLGSVQFAIWLSWFLSPLIDSFSDQSSRRLSHLPSMDKISVFSWAAFMWTWSVDGFLMKVFSRSSILIVVLFKGTFQLIRVESLWINTMKYETILVYVFLSFHDLLGFAVSLFWVCADEKRRLLLGVEHWLVCYEISL